MTPELRRKIIEDYEGKHNPAKKNSRLAEYHRKKLKEQEHDRSKT